MPYESIHVWRDGAQGTTIQAAEAAVKAMEALEEEEMDVQALQDRY